MYFHINKNQRETAQETGKPVFLYFNFKKSNKKTRQNKINKYTKGVLKKYK